MGRILTIISALLLLTLSSCSEDKVIETQTIAFDNEDWNRFFKPEFEFEVLPGVYDVVLEGEFKKAFPESQITVDIFMTAPGGDKRANTYLWILKEDPKNKKKEESSVYKTCELKIRSGFKIAKEGKLYFEVENRSSNFDNPGIKNIKMRVLKKKS